jgi:hypothetical protein
MGHRATTKRKEGVELPFVLGQNRETLEGEERKKRAGEKATRLTRVLELIKLSGAVD